MATAVMPFARQAGSRRGYADEYVSLAALGLYLTGEEPVEAVVVTDGRDDGRIRGQGESCQSGAVEGELVHEFSGHVLGIGRASAVSGPQRLVAGLVGIDNDLCDLGDLVHQGFVGQEGLLDADGFGNLCLDSI